MKRHYTYTEHSALTGWWDYWHHIGAGHRGDLSAAGDTSSTYSNN